MANNKKLAEMWNKATEAHRIKVLTSYLRIAESSARNLAPMDFDSLANYIEATDTLKAWMFRAPYTA